MSNNNSVDSIITEIIKDWTSNLVRNQMILSLDKELEEAYKGTDTIMPKKLTSIIYPNILNALPIPKIFINSVGSRLHTKEFDEALSKENISSAEEDALYSLSFRLSLALDIGSGSPDIQIKELIKKTIKGFVKKDFKLAAEHESMDFIIYSGVLISMYKNIIFNTVFNTLMEELGVKK